MKYKEIQEKFENDTLKFTYTIDGFFTFKPLIPKLENVNFQVYEISFYYDGNSSFYAYENFKTLSNEMQLSQVDRINEYGERKQYIFINSLTYKKINHDSKRTFISVFIKKRLCKGIRIFKQNNIIRRVRRLFRSSTNSV